jgi:hypothetical protein
LYYEKFSHLDGGLCCWYPNIIKRTGFGIEISGANRDSHLGISPVCFLAVWPEVGQEFYEPNES